MKHSKNNNFCSVTLAFMLLLCSGLSLSDQVNSNLTRYLKRIIYT